MIKLLPLILVGYLAGCFQMAYLIGKVNRHIDIRQYGSGNAGTTNALRVMGLKLGLLTFAGDFLKAFLTVGIVLYLTKEPLSALAAGFGVILGHDFPVFLGFRGGKGIASTIGVAFALDYRLGLICLTIMLVVIGLSRYVSLASILLCISLPFGFLFLRQPSGMEQGFALWIALLGIYQHRANIKRLWSGTENKLSFGKKK